MNCCVVVKVSRRSVTFWYQTEEKRFSPLVMKGTNEVPLYFYVENNQFVFGAHARVRFYRHDPNAYGDYFALIKDPSRHFVLHNSPKRVKQLLYYGIEQYLSHFLNTILYKSDSIESYRAGFPLKFIFEADLGGPEHQLVADMFTEAGYRTVTVLHYNESLLEYLRQSSSLRSDQAALMLTGLEDTLYLELYTAGVTIATGMTALPGQGADPRIRILAGMMLDYIQEQNPYLTLDLNREVNALLPYGAELLRDKRMIISGDAELTGGDKFWFSIKLKNVEDRLQYYAGDLLVSTAVNDLLGSAGIGQEQAVLLLCSDQIKTTYFSDRLLKQYQHVKSITPAQSEEAMQLIFNKPVAQTGSSRQLIAPVLLPPLPPKAKAAPAPAASPPLPAVKSFTKPGLPPLPAVKPAGGERPKPLVPPLPPIKKKI